MGRYKVWVSQLVGSDSERDQRYALLISPSALRKTLKGVRFALIIYEHFLPCPSVIYVVFMLILFTDWKQLYWHYFLNVRLWLCTLMCIRIVIVFKCKFLLCNSSSSRFYIYVFSLQYFSKICYLTLIKTCLELFRSLFRS